MLGHCMGDTACWVEGPEELRSWKSLSSGTGNALLAAVTTSTVHLGAFFPQCPVCLFCKGNSDRPQQLPTSLGSFLLPSGEALWHASGPASLGQIAAYGFPEPTKGEVCSPRKPPPHQAANWGTAAYKAMRTQMQPLTHPRRAAGVQGLRLRG